MILLSIAPADLSKYPDFPKPEGRTPEGYQEAIKKYWKGRAKKNYKANIRERERTQQIQMMKNNRMRGPGKDIYNRLPQVMHLETGVVEQEGQRSNCPPNFSRNLPTFLEN